MRRIVRRLSAAGFSPWVFMDHRKENFLASLDYQISSGATLTAKMQYTFDHPHQKRRVNIARTTTTATVTDALHGLVAGDYIVVENTPAPFAGEFSVATIVDANSYTYTVANSGATAAAADLGSARVTDDTDMTGMTADEHKTLTFPVTALRLVVTAYTGGFGELGVLQAG